MKSVTRLLLLALCLAAFVVLMLPVAAQDEIAPGEGAPVISPNFGADIATLNPILAQDGTSQEIIDLIYPPFLGVDIETGFFGESIPRQLVDSWEISEDGLTYTFHLRDDFVWSDGTPVTSADVLYVWNAIQDEGLEANGNLVQTKDVITNVEAPDPQTVVFTFNTPNCSALTAASKYIPVPAHVFEELFGSDYALMNDSDYNLNPNVTSGIFSFQNFRPGEQVTIVANQDYPDGPVYPEGFIQKVVTDQTVQVEQFLAGELTRMGVPSARQAELQELVDAGTYQGFNSLRANYRFVAFNLADPENPQNGLDEDGNPIDQGHHPIFGDVRVRQALNYAIDFEALNQGAFNGFGIQGATHSRPDSWAHPQELEPYPFDQEQAIALLEDAGWTDEDGDGIRECNGCLYAEEGAPLAFEFITNAGNTSQEAMGTILQDQWGEVGFDVNFQPIDFNVLVETFQAQTFDAVSIFWGFDFPADPDSEFSGVFAPEADVLGAGFNATSYSNPRVNEIVEEARALPGCDQEARSELYQEAYRILHEESPWIWIGGAQTLRVAQNNVANWNPLDTASPLEFHNVQEWQISN